MKKPAKILFADDDGAIVDAVSLILGSEGYEVITTRQGKNVLGIVKQERPDVVLLDIRMSGVNGQELCQELKSSPATRNLPVFLISANQDTERLAEEAGADGFLRKPFEMENLLRLLKKHLG